MIYGISESRILSLWYARVEPRPSLFSWLCLRKMLSTEVDSLLALRSLLIFGIAISDLAWGLPIADLSCCHYEKEAEALLIANQPTVHSPLSVPQCPKSTTGAPFNTWHKLQFYHNNNFSGVERYFQIAGRAHRPAREDLEVLEEQRQVLGPEADLLCLLCDFHSGRVSLVCRSVSCGLPQPLCASSLSAAVGTHYSYAACAQIFV